jgi:hypothetical protein
MNHNKEIPAGKISSSKKRLRRAYNLNTEEFLPKGVKIDTILHLKNPQKNEEIHLGLFEGGVFLHRLAPEKEIFAAGKTYSGLSVKRYPVPLFAWIIVTAAIIFGIIITYYTVTNLQANAVYPLLLALSLGVIALGIGGLIRYLWVMSLFKFEATIGKESAEYNTRSLEVYANIKEFMRDALKK